MKTIRLLLALLLSVGLLTGCAAPSTNAVSDTPMAQQTPDAISETESGRETPPATEPSAQSAEGKALVAYFSCTGNTEAIAEMIAQHTGADLYQITPQEPYTPEDLNYSDSSSRSSMEENDPAARPVISNTVDDMAGYDTVFLGYPIWWGKAPKIISTFLESYDFGGKTIVPFCTSGSSGIGTSDTGLYALCEDSVRWLPGKRFAASDAQETIAAWIDDLDILIF